MMIRDVDMVVVAGSVDTRVGLLEKDGIEAERFTVD